MQYENEAKSTEDSAICTLRIRSLKAKHLCMSWRACSPVLTLTDRDGSAWPPWHGRLAGLAGSCPVCRGDAMSKWRFGCSSEWLLLIVWKLSRVLGWLAPKASQTASPQAVLAARARGTSQAPPLLATAVRGSPPPAVRPIRRRRRSPCARPLVAPPRLPTAERAHPRRRRPRPRADPPARSPPAAPARGDRKARPADADGVEHARHAVRSRLLLLEHQRVARERAGGRRPRPDRARLRRSLARWPGAPTAPARVSAPSTAQHAPRTSSSASAAAGTITGRPSGCTDCVRASAASRSRRSCPRRPTSTPAHWRCAARRRGPRAAPRSPYRLRWALPAARGAGRAAMVVGTLYVKFCMTVAYPSCYRCRT